MTEPRNDDRSQARREAAALLGVDIDHLSPADGLRIDMVSALRLVIDHEQATVLSGNQADLGKLNVAVHGRTASPGSCRAARRLTIATILGRRASMLDINILVGSDPSNACIPCCMSSQLGTQRNHSLPSQ
jgi:hypothetical protein